MATICTSANVKLAAGASVSSSLTGNDFSEFINQAEGQLIADTGVNWVTHWPTLSGQDYGKVVEGAVAAYAGTMAIRYKPSGYAQLNEAITIMNANLEIYNRAIAKLKDSNVYEPFGGTKLT